MATLVPYTPSQITLQIDGTDCLGDSRITINRNVSSLETAVYNLSTTSTSFNTRLTTLSSTVTALNTSFNITKVGSLTTLGTLVTALSVFNTAGSYIGYIPIYR
jgi:hypothetical protein